MRKRSAHVALAIVGAATFSLAGCRDEQVDATAFPDLQSCRAAASTRNDLSDSDCTTAFQEAQKLNVETAPRYDSKQVCEEQHGEGNCETEAQAYNGGSGSIFMPLMTGLLLGQLLSGRSGMSPVQPLYRNAGGGYTNAQGTARYSGNAGQTKMSSSLFKKAPTTVGKAPMTKASLASRGGFGSTGSSRGIFGG